MSAECLWGVSVGRLRSVYGVSVELCLWGCRLEELEEGLGRPVILGHSVEKVTRDVVDEG